MRITSEVCQVHEAVFAYPDFKGEVGESLQKINTQNL